MNINIIWNKLKYYIGIIVSFILFFTIASKIKSKYQALKNKREKVNRLISAEDNFNERLSNIKQRESSLDANIDANAKKIFAYKKDKYILRQKLFDISKEKKELNLSIQSDEQILKELKKRYDN